MQFGITTPPIRVGETETPTTYTIAPLRGSATVVVTTGLLSTLLKAGVAAVLAHELAHIANRDAAVLSAASTGIVLCGIVYRFVTRLGRSASDSGDVADFMIEGFLSGVVGLLTLTFLIPAAQRDIVKTAIDDGEYVVESEATPSSALAGLVDRFREQEQVHALDETGDGDLSGPYLVRFDGEVYWTILILSAGTFGTESGTAEQT